MQQATSRHVLRSLAALAIGAGALGSTAIAANQPTQQPQGRDWTKIDTNKDGHISPEEMETWLKANPGPQR